jgi:serine/threonine protein kinase
MSPQILAQEPYTSKCDIWSIGVLFYEMLYGRHPWIGKGIVDLYTKIETHKEVVFPAEVEVSELAKSLIIQCLRFDENDRLSWMELYEHDLWGEDFHHVARMWRAGYKEAREMIEHLRERIRVEVLVGVFLRVRTPALNFLQFHAIMNSLFS